VFTQAENGFYDSKGRGWAVKQEQKGILEAMRVDQLQTVPNTG